MAISRQKEAWSRDYALPLFRMTSRYGRTSPGILCTHFVQINYNLRPVWPGNFRQIVHNLAEKCKYSSGYVGTAGHGPTSIHNLFTDIPDLSGRCSDHTIMSYLCRATAFIPAILNGRNKGCSAVAPCTCRDMYVTNELYSTPATNIP